MLKLRIASTRLVEGTETEKKFVAYMLQARVVFEEPGVRDPEPANVERRYTHFLELYNGLKKDHSALLDSMSFPGKKVVGNFDYSVISARVSAFQLLLQLITKNSQLMDSPVMISFLHEIELIEARRLIEDKKYDQALSVLETSFKLLNKVYTDRSRVVLATLCRIVACAEASGGALAGPVERYAQIALRRYEAVSDSDLLLIYIPLLHSCISIWETLGRDKSKLIAELNGLRKRGMNVDGTQSLMEAVDSLDTYI